MCPWLLGSYSLWNLVFYQNSSGYRNLEVSYKALKVDRWETVSDTECVLVVWDTLWGVTRVKCSGIVRAPHGFSGLKSWDADPVDLKKRAASAGLPVWEHSLILGQKKNAAHISSCPVSNRAQHGRELLCLCSFPCNFTKVYRRCQGKNLSGLSLFICGLWRRGGGKIRRWQTFMRCCLCFLREEYTRAQIQSWVELTFILSASWSPLLV